MASWREKNPDFEYIFWTESEFERRDMIFKAQEKIDMIDEYSGKTDIMRLEILSKYGGVFIDADSICIEPIGELFERFADKSGFATFENETSRKGLIANGNLAIQPSHPLLTDMLDWILSPASDIPIRTLRSWGSVGPALLTRFLETGNYPGFTVLPSYYFLPIHFTGAKYTGHRKVYAHQLWGSNYAAYNKGLVIELPEDLLIPSKNITLIIDLNQTNPSSQNIPYPIKKMIETIKSQCGLYIINIIFILDDPIIYERYYRDLLTDFKRTSRFIHIRIMSKKKFDSLIHICKCKSQLVSGFISDKCNCYHVLKKYEDIIKKPYIHIHPTCILYPQTIYEVMGGSAFSAPIYKENLDGKVITTGESFIVRLCFI